MAREGLRVRMGIESYMGQGYENEASGVRVEAVRHRYLFVMTMLSGARVVRVMCVCAVAPCWWAAWVCIGVASECARWWMTPLCSSSTRRFLFLMMPKRRDSAKSVSESISNLNKL